MLACTEMRANGDTVPLNYNLMGGRRVGILADPSRNSLDLAVDPSADGGAMEINLPRNVIDSKFSDGRIGIIPLLLMVTE